LQHFIHFTGLFEAAFSSIQDKIMFGKEPAAMNEDSTVRVASHKK
jgi:hypothetical protein